MLSIRLPSDIEERLAALAEATGKTRTTFARDVILSYMEELEDIAIAERRLADIRAGREEPIPLESLLEEYGLER